MANKAYKYRIYPNKAQGELIQKTFGCVRFVYNHFLEDRINAYKETGESRTFFQQNKMLTALKQEHLWLQEPDKNALQNALRYLNTAYQNFFRRVKNHEAPGFPKYKNKKSGRKSYTTSFTNGNIVVCDCAVKLPKLGMVKAKISRIPPEGWRIKAATVSQDVDGKYYVSVCFEYEAPQQVTAEPTFDKVVGLDYKTNGLYVNSEGHSAEMPKYYKASCKKLAKEQRKLSCKVVGSGKWKKQNAKVNAVHKKISNQRKDFLHKESLSIAKAWDLVCIEDISIKEQVQERKYKAFRKSTLDNGWYEFTQMLNYKLADRGKRLIKVDKSFPSTKTCSVCGEINDALDTDAIRKWKCPHCGAERDRDYNATVNIRNEGWRMYQVA